MRSIICQKKFSNASLRSHQTTAGSVQLMYSFLESLIANSDDFSIDLHKDISRFIKDAYEKKRENSGDLRSRDFGEGSAWSVLEEPLRDVRKDDLAPLSKASDFLSKNRLHIDFVTHVIDAAIQAKVRVEMNKLMKPKTAELIVCQTQGQMLTHLYNMVKTIECLFLKITYASPLGSDGEVPIPEAEKKYLESAAIILGLSEPYKSLLAEPDSITRKNADEQLKIITLLIGLNKLVTILDNCRQFMQIKGIRTSAAELSAAYNDLCKQLRVGQSCQILEQAGIQYATEALSLTSAEGIFLTRPEAQKFVNVLRLPFTFLDVPNHQGQQQQHPDLPRKSVWIGGGMICDVPNRRVYIATVDAMRSIHALATTDFVTVLSHLHHRTNRQWYPVILFAGNMTDFSEHLKLANLTPRVAAILREDLYFRLMRQHQWLQENSSALFDQALDFVKTSFIREIPTSPEERFAENPNYSPVSGQTGESSPIDVGDSYEFPAC